MNHGALRVCVRTSETAGPSTTLRSGRDDNFIATKPLGSVQPSDGDCPNLVIPTGAKRSGGTCGFASSHADSLAPEVRVSMLRSEQNLPCNDRTSAAKAVHAQEAYGTAEAEAVPFVQRLG
jgi:hypothetical protein